jgi:hypothetical protein
MNYVVIEKAKTKVKVPIHLHSGKMAMGYRYKGISKKELEDKLKGHAYDNEPLSKEVLEVLFKKYPISNRKVYKGLIVDKKYESGDKIKIPEGVSWSTDYDSAKFFTQKGLVGVAKTKGKYKVMLSAICKKGVDLGTAFHYSSYESGLDGFAEEEEVIMLHPTVGVVE